MSVYLRSGNLAAAAGIAKEFAPYQPSKMASAAPERVPLPQDLLADPEPQADEPGPAIPAGRNCVSAGRLPRCCPNSRQRSHAPIRQQCESISEVSAIGIQPACPEAAVASLQLYIH